MKKKNNMREGIKGKRREESVKAGAYDGRFAHRVETPKNAYKRKPKHRKNTDEDQ
jgi:stalled ribosome alternative rescue factor ArfA